MNRRGFFGRLFGGALAAAGLRRWKSSPPITESDPDELLIYNRVSGELERLEVPSDSGAFLRHDGTAPYWESPLDGRSRSYIVKDGVVPRTGEIVGVDRDGHLVPWTPDSIAFGVVDGDVVGDTSADPPAVGWVRIK